MSKGPKSEAGKEDSSSAAQGKPVEKLKVKDREDAKVTGKGNKPGDSSDQNKPAKKKQDDQAVDQSVADLRQFFSEVYFEFRKISWPERPQVIRETYSVLVLVSLITVMVLAFDFAVSKVVFEPLDHFAKKLGGGLGTHMVLPEKPAQDQSPAPGGTMPLTLPPQGAPTEPAKSPATSESAPPTSESAPAPKESSTSTSQPDKPPATSGDATKTDTQGKR